MDLLLQQFHFLLLEIPDSIINLKRLKKQYGVKSLYKTLVKTKVSADSYFVYVAVKDDYRKYNGCDALLNLYLGG